MKVEFLTNTDTEDGRQVFIPASEFLKAEKDDSEFESFAFATHAFFALYKIDRFITGAEYDYIRRFLNKNGAVIITTVEDRYTKRIYPEVYVSINEKRTCIHLDAADVNSRK